MVEPARAARLLALALALLPGACGDGTASGRQVVLYCALDEQFSRAIAEDFEKRTGIQVRYLTDAEVDKSVGLRAKILQERGNPQCDVFWNNEPGNTEVLRRAGVLQAYASPAAKGLPDEFVDPDAYWTGFAARPRVLIVNTRLVKPEDEPHGLADLPKFGKRAAIAAPLAGMTATHAAALYVHWGEAKARAFFDQVRGAGVIVADGNAMVARMVADGEAAVGLTDIDDVHVALKQGKPVKLVYPDQGEGQDGTPLFPNTVSLVAGAPHPEEGKALIDYVLSADIEARLAAGESAQMPLRPGVPVPSPAPPGFQFDWRRLRRFPTDWRRIGERLPDVIEEMRTRFVR